MVAWRRASAATLRKLDKVVGVVGHRHELGEGGVGGPTRSGEDDGMEKSIGGNAGKDPSVGEKSDGTRAARASRVPRASPALSFQRTRKLVMMPSSPPRL